MGSPWLTSSYPSRIPAGWHWGRSPTVELLLDMHKALGSFLQHQKSNKASTSHLPNRSILFNSRAICLLSFATWTKQAMSILASVIPHIQVLLSFGPAPSGLLPDSFLHDFIFPHGQRLLSGNSWLRINSPSTS